MSKVKEALAPADYSEFPDWVEWEGGSRPTHPDTMVMVRLRTGFIWPATKSYQHDWEHRSTRSLFYGNDIIAYRIAA